MQLRRASMSRSSRARRSDATVTIVEVHGRDGVEELCVVVLVLVLESVAAGQLK
jgi:hypothetical protein